MGVIDNHVEGCTCDRALMKDTLAKVHRQRTPGVYDAEGNFLFSCDSFGFRGQMPGESDACYEEQKRKMNESMAWMADEDA